MRIFGLGSCRVHNPLLACHRSGEIEYLNTRIKSREVIYLHSPLEMLQFVEVLAERKQIPADIAEFVYRRGLPPLDYHTKTICDDADSFVLELCTQKKYWVDDIALNTNEIDRLLVSPAGDAGRAWWINLHSDRKQIAELAKRVEEKFEAGGAPVSDTQRMLLREMQYAEISPDEMTKALSDLRDALGTEPIIVPHISVKLANGEPLKERGRHIKLVTTAAEKLGFSIFDPAALLERDGQENVLANNGFDFNHYNDAYLLEAGREMVKSTRRGQEQRAFPSLGHDTASLA